MILYFLDLAKSCIFYNMDIAFFTIFENANCEQTDLRRHIRGTI
jgi:hypothetical protein